MVPSPLSGGSLGHGQFQDNNLCPDLICSIHSAAAAAAKSLQSCLTLCDPIEGSPPGSPIPGILQARTLEWVAISFSSAWKWKVKVKSLSRVRLFATPWTAAHQAPPPMGFSRQEFWSGLPLPSLSIHSSLEEICLYFWPAETLSTLSNPGATHQLQNFQYEPSINRCVCAPTPGTYAKFFKWLHYCAGFRWRFSLSLLHPSFLEARRNVQNPTLLPNLFHTWVPPSSVIPWSGTWATAAVWGHTDVALPFLQGVKVINTCCIIFGLWNWRDSEQASPKYASVANGLSWVEDNRGSKDLGRVFSLPLICLK